MARTPDFNADDLRELRRLRVTTEQVNKLRVALVWIRAFACPASRAKQPDVAAILCDLERLSVRLSKRLAALPIGASAEHRVAFLRLLEALYAAGFDEGLLDAIAPSLQTLAAAAGEAKVGLPATRGRGRTADPRPIDRIAEALGVAPSKRERFKAVAVVCYCAAGAGDPMRAIESAMAAHRAQQARIRAAEAAITRATKRRQKSVIS